MEPEKEGAPNRSRYEPVVNQDYSSVPNRSRYEPVVNQDYSSVPQKSDLVKELQVDIPLVIIITHHHHHHHFLCFPFPVF